jgi:hypothetical protein
MTCSKPCTFRRTNLIMIRAYNEHELLDKNLLFCKMGEWHLCTELEGLFANLMPVQIKFPRISPLTKVGFHLVV